ncbi:MAG: hypothetical protein ACKV22_14995 [Bryobacteraceae bacterium]
MKEATKRSIIRWIHIVFSIPILGYIYSPFDALPAYAPRVRFVVVPLMVLSGLWMWKGHVLRRLISMSSAENAAAATGRPKTGQQIEA